jgi:hypothetical protein
MVLLWSEVIAPNNQPTLLSRTVIHPDGVGERANRSTVVIVVVVATLIVY